MEEKKSKSSVVIIIVLLLIIIGLTGYILVEKDIIKLSTKSTTEEQQSPKKEAIDKVAIDKKNPYIQNWFNQVHGYAFQGDKEIYEKGGNTVAQMDNSYKFNIAMRESQSDIYSYYLNATGGAEVPEEIVKKEYENLFGPNTYQSVQTLTVGCDEYSYDSTAKKYIAKSFGCGSTTTFFAPIEEIISAIKYNDRIEIISAVVYIDKEENSLYKDYNKTEKLTDMSASYIADPKATEELTTYIKTNKDNLEQYTYTFKLNEDGFYYYREVKRTKE